MRTSKIILVLSSVIFLAIVTLWKHKSRVEVATMVPSRVPQSLIQESKRTLLASPGKMRIRVRSSADCQLGELDSLEIAQFHFPDEKFLLTVEPLISAEGGVIASRSVTLAEVNKGVDWTIATPKQAILTGLYLCSDATREGSCKNKVAMNPSRMVVEITQNGTKGHKPDQVYYFQPVVLEQNEILLPTVPLGSAELAGIISRSLEIEPVLAAISERFAILNPSAPTLQTDGIDLVLSRHKGAVCDDEAK